MDREKLLQIGIDFREGKRSEKTWNDLNDSMDKPFASGESYRCFVKKELKKVNKLPSKEEVVTEEMQNKLEEIDLKIIELQKERKKVQTTKIEYNRILRESAREEMLFEELQKSIEKYAVNPPKFNEIAKINNNKKDGIMSFSDIHYGKIFESITNKYSEKESISRMNKLLNETVEICKKEGLTHLHVINGSDSIEGMCLRISQLMNLEMGITDMTIRFARMMVEFLNELSKYIYITYHHMPTSNHGEIRPLGTRAGQFPNETMEKVIIAYLHDMLQKNERIEIVEYKQDYIDFKIFNFNVMGKHGHQIKNLKSAIKDLTMKHRKFIDYFYTAHLHHGMTVTVGESENNNCEVILIPSVMGTDDYADDLMTGSKASALLDIYTEDEGRKIQYNILLN